MFTHEVIQNHRYSDISRNMAATNKPEPILADIMENIISMKATLTDVQMKISNLEKLEHKVNEIKENQDQFNFRVVQVEESQEYISKCFEKQQGDIDKILATNTRLEKENIQLYSSIIISVHFSILNKKKESNWNNMGVEK